MAFWPQKHYKKHKLNSVSCPEFTSACLFVAIVYIAFYLCHSLHLCILILQSACFVLSAHVVIFYFAQLFIYNEFLLPGY